MGERDNSYECETCKLYRGGINDLKCECDGPQLHLSFVQTPDVGPSVDEREHAVTNLLNALIYPDRDFIVAWDNACRHFGKFGEVPAKIALLEVAISDACDIALSKKRLTRSEKSKIDDLLALTK